MKREVESVHHRFTVRHDRTGVTLSACRSLKSHRVANKELRAGSEFCLRQPAGAGRGRGNRMAAVLWWTQL